MNKRIEEGRKISLRKDPNATEKALSDGLDLKDLKYQAYKEYSIILSFSLPVWFEKNQM